MIGNNISAKIEWNLRQEPETVEELNTQMVCQSAFNSLKMTVGYNECADQSTYAKGAIAALRQIFPEIKTLLLLNTQLGQQLNAAKAAAQTEAWDDFNAIKELQREGAELRAQISDLRKMVEANLANRLKAENESKAP